MSGSAGGGADGDWKAYFANKQQVQEIHQDLGSVNARSTLAVTCSAMRASGTNGDAGGIVFFKILVDGVVESSVNIDTTAQTADVWYDFTNTVTLANSGELILMLTRETGTGEVWIDAISDVSVVSP